ncbi:MAG TPA: hypothetical protein VIY49_19560 [Bryobacteraceae bacterium]
MRTRAPRVHIVAPPNSIPSIFKNLTRSNRHFASFREVEITSEFAQSDDKGRGMLEGILNAYSIVALGSMDFVLGDTDR